MSKFTVNYNTGVGNEFANTLEEAMKLAIEGASYTQRPIAIEDEYGNELAYLPWYGIEPDEDDVVAARFGDYGFYGEWQIHD